VAAVVTAGIPRWRVWPAVTAALAAPAAMRRSGRRVTAEPVVLVGTASVLRLSPGWTVPLPVMVAPVAPVVRQLQARPVTAVWVAMVVWVVAAVAVLTGLRAPSAARMAPRVA
jgi:hypothetical protein